MNEPIIFEGVGKKYRFWGYHAFTVRDEFEALVRRLSLRYRAQKQASGDEDKTSFWALRDINLRVPKGEALGIIGSNGAGKTTMLKLMCGIIYPTKGSISTYGRLGSLIDLGAGLHGDLTGRDNIYIYGSIIGMNRRELKEKFNSIVDFSELGKFIDEPVKYYSSGMELRLAFSVTLHLNPDILVIDEVLAVGDEKFYHKSLEAMSGVIKSGRTVVMVSHNLASVSNFCKRVILLEQGRIVCDGHPQEVILDYQSRVSQAQTIAAAADIKRRWGTGDAIIKTITFLDDQAREGAYQSLAGGKWAFKLEYEAKRRVDAPVFGMVIHNNRGEIVYGENNGLDNNRPLFIEGNGSVIFRTPSLALPAGRYYLSVYVQDVNKIVVYDWHDQSYAFELVETRPIERLGHLYLVSAWEYRH